MSVVRHRFAGLDRAFVDPIFAVAVTVGLELQCWLGHGVPEAHRPVTAVASVLFAAPIAVRRRWPGVALLFCVVVAAIFKPLGSELLIGLNGDVVPVLVLAYSAGAWVDGAHHSVRLMMLGLAVLGAWSLLTGDGGAPTGAGPVAGALFYAAALIVPAWFVGRLVRGHSARATAFHELALQTTLERELRESAAILAERTRIGSELQDIISHSVSAMVIQAGGARRMLRTNPARARESILNVEQTGREALADLRRLLGILRKDEDPRALAPQPGLKQLGALIQSMREAAMTCDLNTEGTPIDLTPGVDLVSYRVVETVLQSAAQHRSAHAAVTIRYRPGTLQLEVLGDISIPDIDNDLRAIAERVALYDGSVRTVPASAGFAVHARLPVAETVPE
jgi:signal transduction histidine kinase